MSLKTQQKDRLNAVGGLLYLLRLAEFIYDSPVFDTQTMSLSLSTRRSSIYWQSATTYIRPHTSTCATSGVQ